MSRNAAQLCTLLVEDLLGDLAATIFGVLATNGRLPLDLLSERTRLNPRRLRAGLAALIQQNLVLWGPSERDHGAIYYEACLERAEHISHYGRYVKIVTARYNKVAGQVVEELLLHGSLKICDLVRECMKNTQNTAASNDEGTGPNGVVTNGISNAGSNLESSLDDLHAAIGTLREAEIVINYRESYRRPEADNRTIAENIIGSTGNYPGGPKSKNYRMLQLEVEKLLQTWRRGIESSEYEEGKAGQTAGSKRKARSKESSQEPPQKKLKADAVNGLIGSTSSSGHLAGDSSKNLSEDDTGVHINFDKLALLLRNATVVQSVEKTIGSTTAQVYAAVVHLTFPKLHRCRTVWVKPVDLVDADQPYEEAPLLSTGEIFKAVDQLEDLESSIAPVPDDSHIINPVAFARRHRRPPSDQDGKKDKRKKKKKRKRGEEALSEDSEDEVMDGIDDAGPNGHHLSNDDIAIPDRTPYGLVRQHLFLLASHSTPFLAYSPPTTNEDEKWSVPFPDLMRTLRLDLVCNTIHTTQDHIRLSVPDDEYAGTSALRIARILSEYGKLDEKALTARSLLPPKVLRARCEALHIAGLIELQEVPRDQQRQPGRTMFMWYLDLGRAGTRVAEDARANMVRLLQRRKLEVERRKGVLEKASRSDVRGHEHELLHRTEQVALQRWDEAEHRIWGGVARLGEAVATMMEY